MIEYGKNYDGYWTGELFVKQVIANTHYFMQIIETLYVSFVKRLSLHSKKLIGLAIKPCSWLTILKDMQHI
jgi:hypothetical protein